MNGDTKTVSDCPFSRYYIDMEQNPPILNQLCALIALMAAIAIPSLVVISRAFKRSQQWQAEVGHDRAARRDYE
jgi:hypothetical protein